MGELKAGFVLFSSGVILPRKWISEEGPLDHVNATAGSRASCLSTEITIFALGRERENQEFVSDVIF